MFLYCTGVVACMVSQQRQHRYSTARFSFSTRWRYQIRTTSSGTSLWQPIGLQQFGGKIRMPCITSEEKNKTCPGHQQQHSQHWSPQPACGNHTKASFAAQHEFICKPLARNNTVMNSLCLKFSVQSGEMRKLALSQPLVALVSLAKRWAWSASALLIRCLTVRAVL